MDRRTPLSGFTCETLQQWFKMIKLQLRLLLPLSISILSAPINTAQVYIDIYGKNVTSLWQKWNSGTLRIPWGELVLTLKEVLFINRLLFYTMDVIHIWLSKYDKMLFWQNCQPMGNWVIYVNNKHQFLVGFKHGYLSYLPLWPTSTVVFFCA